MSSKRYSRVIALLMSGALVLSGTGCGKGSGEGAAPDEESSASLPEDSGAGQEGPAAAEWTPEQLLQADFLLYNVDCASADASVFADGQPCGLCQSVSDQPYGADPGSGMSWGYQAEDYIVREEDHLGEGITANKWSMAEESYAGGEDAAFRYDFQLPAGEYQVTVGFYNPFGPRKIDVDCEGERMVDGDKLLRYQLTQEQFSVRVEDGELNLKVFNGSGKRAMDIPILSYIQIAVAPEYTRELLELALQKYVPAGEPDSYTAASYERYSLAAAEAEDLLGEASPDASALKDKFIQLKEGYEMIAEKCIYNSFRPGEQWRDTENNLIQAHGGQVQQLEIWDGDAGGMVSKWVWVGEDKTAGARGGIRAYSSDDLYNWQYEGVIMRNVPSRDALDTDAYFQDLYAGYTAQQLDNVYRSLDAQSAIIERPKMIYNGKTGQYVLWFHADGPTETSDSSYAAACAGVAVSDSPFGPYRFIDRYRLNVCPDDQEDQHPSSKGMARDMNLFVDTDGTAYIIYSSEENLTLYISRLDEEYTYLAVAPEEAVYGRDFIRLFPGAQREAPAVFKRDGIYYLVSSGCTGWAPNRARYYRSDSMLGEWSNMGDPCIGDDKGTTFGSQSTCVFEDASGNLVYMGDRWNSDNLSDSRYVWLPIEFTDDGGMELRWQDEWRHTDDR